MRQSFALAVALGASMASCSQIQAQPAVGTIDSCAAAAPQCRPIAEAAARDVPGSAVVLDGFTIQDAACDVAINDQPAPPDAATATACYLVDASGVVGGERINPHAYKGGRPVSITSLVWASADGSLHAKTTVTDTLAQ